jgi:hypothetical protein
MANTIDLTSANFDANIEKMNQNTSNVQLAFATTQMSLAKISKQRAQTYMTEITKAQDKARECAKMVSTARGLQADAKKNDSSIMPDSMVTYFRSLDLKYDTKGDDNKHNSTEWDFNIKSLTNYQEMLGANTQQLMVYLQDFMGQYNSYLTGSNSAIEKSNQTLLALNKPQG